MILNLTDLSNESLQSQIIRQIRAKILSGELETGGSLPSIRGLAREAHVSVITVQRAYESLERENLIHSRRGKGFFVSALKDERKNEIARENLSLKIEPIIKIAQNEGLSHKEILEVINNTLNRSLK